MPVTTRLSLIARISDPDDSESWAEFVSLYGPFIYAIARNRGLQDADACDLVQDVMREVSRSVSRFDPDPGMGRFRGWLGVITRRMLARFFEKGRSQVKGAGGTTNLVALSNISTHHEEEIWEQEHQRHVFRWAVERVRNDFTETTWRAFWLTAVESVAARRAAEECDMTVGAVYIAKSRVVSRLRQRVAQVMGSHPS